MGTHKLHFDRVLTPLFIGPEIFLFHLFFHLIILGEKLESYFFMEEIWRNAAIWSRVSGLVNPLSQLQEYFHQHQCCPRGTLVTGWSCPRLFAFCANRTCTTPYILGLYPYQPYQSTPIVHPGWGKVPKRTIISYSQRRSVWVNDKHAKEKWHSFGLCQQTLLAQPRRTINPNPLVMSGKAHESTLHILYIPRLSSPTYRSLWSGKLTWQWKWTCWRCIPHRNWGFSSQPC